MKTKLITGTVMLVSVVAAVAQQFENDDLYFTKKDRDKIEAVEARTVKQATVEAGTVKKNFFIFTPDEIGNPTDSYSGRHINPDNNANTSSKNTSDNTQYFNPNYVPSGVNNQLYQGNPGSFCSPYYSNNYYNSGGYYPNSWGYGNPGYGYGGWNNGYGYNSWNNGYNGWNSWNSGWNLMFTFGWGSPYSNFGNSWYCPYGYNNYGYNNYWGGSYYQGNVVNINTGDVNSKVVYGKRISRSTELNNDYDPNENRNTNTAVVDSQGRNRGANGRIANTQPYYQRGWRQDPNLNTNANTNTNRSGRLGNTSTSTTTRSSWGRSGWNDNGWNNTRSNNSSFDNRGSRSSTISPNTGGGGRTSTGGSGSSGGRTRGRD